MTEREQDQVVNQFRSLPSDQRGKFLDRLIKVDDEEEKRIRTGVPVAPADEGKLVE